MLELKMPLDYSLTRQEWDGNEVVVTLSFDYYGSDIPDLYWVDFPPTAEQPEGMRLHYTALSDDDCARLLDYIIANQEKKKGKGCY